METFELALAGFHVAEIRGVPGGRVCECDRFGFDGSQLIKTGGERFVVVVNEVIGVSGRVGGQNGRKRG